VFSEKPSKINYLNENLMFLISPDQYENTAPKEYMGDIVFVDAPGGDTYRALDVDGNIAFEFPRKVAIPDPILLSNAKGHYKMSTREAFTLSRKPFERTEFLVNEKGKMLLPPEFVDIKANE
jgi:hypothetical protein